MVFRGMAKFGIALGSGPRGLGFESRYSDHRKALEMYVSSAFSYFLPTFIYIFLRKVNKKVNNVYVLVGIDRETKGFVINGKHYSEQEKRQGYLL